MVFSALLQYHAAEYLCRYEYVCVLHIYVYTHILVYSRIQMTFPAFSHCRRKQQHVCVCMCNNSMDVYVCTTTACICMYVQQQYGCLWWMFMCV
jgi:hypothetical protein